MVHEERILSLLQSCSVRASRVLRGQNNFAVYRQMVYSCPEGRQYCRKFGNRREVLDGIAYCTTGKLTADRLEERNGKIISKKRSELGKKRYASKNPFKGSTLRPAAAVVEDEKQQEVKPVSPEPVEPPPQVRKRKKARRGGRGKRKRRSAA